MAGSIIASANFLLGSVNPDVLSENMWRKQLEYNAFGQNKLAAYPTDRTFVRFPYIVDGNGTPTGARIEQYNQSGHLLWSQTLTGVGRGITVDPRNGDIVATTLEDASNNTLHKYNKNGVHQWSLPRFVQPRAVDVSSLDGSIYVSGINSPPIKYDQDGVQVFVAQENTPFTNDDDFASIAVDPTDNSFVVAVYRSTIDTRPGAIRYDATGNIVWQDPDIIGYAVVIDPSTNAIYVAGVGEPTFSAPSVRKYTPAGGITWSWNSNDHYADIAFDPDLDCVYVIGVRDVNTSPFYALVKITADASTITQHFPQGVSGFSCIVLGDTPVFYPNEATTTEILGTSATFEWEPPG